MFEFTDVFDTLRATGILLAY